MPPKESTFELNSIALAVAIVFIRHRFKCTEVEMCAEELVAEINGLPDHDDFCIENAAILRQRHYFFSNILDKNFNCVLNHN